jgi:hypothetical protein
MDLMQACSRHLIGLSSFPFLVSPSFADIRLFHRSRVYEFCVDDVGTEANGCRSRCASDDIRILFCYCVVMSLCSFFHGLVFAYAINLALRQRQPFEL